MANNLEKLLIKECKKARNSNFVKFVERITPYLIIAGVAAIGALYGFNLYYNFNKAEDPLKNKVYNCRADN